MAIKRKFNIAIEQTDGIGQWFWAAYIKERGKGIVFEKYGMSLTEVMKATAKWVLEQQDKANS